MRIAVVGGGGQLGAAIVDEYSAANHDIRSFSHSELDTTDDAAVIAALEATRPEVAVRMRRAATRSWD